MQSSKIPRRRRRVLMAGNIGAGKTSVGGRIALQLDKDSGERDEQWVFIEEPHAANPYLVDFYQNMARWGFHTETHFMLERVGQLLKAQTQLPVGVDVVEDRGFRQGLIFAKLTLSPVEFETYELGFRLLADRVPLPTAVVYLRASVSTLLERIVHRDRKMEEDIDPDYLAKLNDGYEEWIIEMADLGVPVLVVPSDDADFINSHDDFAWLVAAVRKELKPVTVLQR